MSDKQKIVKLLQAAGGMPFGGYVRDQIAGEESSDVDVFFKEPLGSGSLAGLSRLDNIKKSLRAQGFDVTVSNVLGMTYQSSSSDLKRIMMEIRSKGPQWSPPICVDLVFSATGQTNPFGSVDADVNALYIAEDGKIKAHDRFDVDTVIDHIRRRVYEAVDMPQNRVRKMMSKGYRSLSHFEIEDEREAQRKKKQEGFEHQQQKRAAVGKQSHLAYHGGTNDARLRYWQAVVCLAVWHRGYNSVGRVRVSKPEADGSIPSSSTSITTSAPFEKKSHAAYFLHWRFAWMSAYSSGSSGGSLRRMWERRSGSFHVRYRWGNHVFW